MISPLTIHKANMEILRLAHNIEGPKLRNWGRELYFLNIKLSINFAKNTVTNVYHIHVH
jgi:hypothetical protein